MAVTVLPAMGWQARIPLLQIMQVLDQFRERKAFRNDQTRLGQVMEQISNDPERREYYISQAIPRMESRQGLAMLEGWGARPSGVKAPVKPQTQEGREYLWERDPMTGQWNRTNVPVGTVEMKWDKARKVGPAEGWPEGTVIQESDTGQVKVLHAPKEPKMAKPIKEGDVTERERLEWQKKKFRIEQKRKGIQDIEQGVLRRYNAYTMTGIPNPRTRKKVSDVIQKATELHTRGIRKDQAILRADREISRKYKTYDRLPGPSLWKKEKDKTAASSLIKPILRKGVPFSEVKEELTTKGWSEEEAEEIILNAVQ